MITLDSFLSFRDAAKLRTRNPETISVLAPGFRVRHIVPSRNDGE